LASKPQVKTLRAHKLAALVVDARLYARRTPEEACALLGWDTRHLLDLESAAITPTLPELEALAAIYAVPVDHFFGSTSLSDEMPKLRVDTMRQRLELRNRILGAMIMQARLRKNLSRDDLSMATNLPLELITDYELGKIPIPVTDLEDITHILQIRVEDWIDSYAIPTRDMIIKPFTLSSRQTEEEEESREPEPVEKAEPERPAPKKVEPVAAEPVSMVEPTQSVQAKHEPAVSSAEKESASVTQPSQVEIDLLARENLPKELIEFVTNPINRQYLLLANNLSQMPADQLRRIAESLLEITF